MFVSFTTCSTHTNISADKIYYLYYVNRGSYISDPVLLNLLNKMWKRDKNAMLAEYFISFSQKNEKFNDTGA